MAIYEYRCEEHGLFEKMRPMAQYRERGICPVCDKSCDRVISNSQTVIIPPQHQATPKTIKPIESKND